MKTNTSLHAQTQDRIQQLKLGVDWHVEHFRVVRMGDGQSPQPAQRFSPASFLDFVKQQLPLAEQVVVVYEAGPGGFHPPRPHAAAEMSGLREVHVLMRHAAAGTDVKRTIGHGLWARQSAPTAR